MMSVWCWVKVSWWSMFCVVGSKCAITLKLLRKCCVINYCFTVIKQGVFMAVCICFYVHTLL